MVHRHRHFDRTVSVSFSDHVYNLVRSSWMNRVWDQSVPEAGGSGLARTSSDVREVQSVILSVWTNPTAAEADRAAVVEEEPEGVSIPAVIRPGSAAPRAKKTIFASHRDAA